MLPFTMEDVLGFIRKILTAYKHIMAWLGILVLPEEVDLVNYPPSPNHDIISGE